MKFRQWEQRKECRYPGQTLLLKVNGRQHPFIDISTGGLSFEGEKFTRGQDLNVRISSVFDDSFSVSTTCRVTNACGYRIGVLFTNPNLRLYQYIIKHIAEVTSTIPYIINGV